MAAKKRGGRPAPQGQASRRLVGSSAPARTPDRGEASRTASREPAPEPVPTSRRHNERQWLDPRVARSASPRPLLRRVGLAAASRLPRLHLRLRRAAEASQPRLLRRVQPRVHPGPTRRRRPPEPDPLAHQSPDPRRSAARPPDRVRRGGRRPWHTAGPVGTHRRRRGDAPLVHAVPHGQLPLEPLLHGVRHRLRLRVDAARGGWRGRRAVRRLDPGEPRPRRTGRGTNGDRADPVLGRPPRLRLPRPRVLRRPQRRALRAGTVSLADPAGERGTPNGPVRGGSPHHRREGGRHRRPHSRSAGRRRPGGRARPAGRGADDDQDAHPGGHRQCGADDDSTTAGGPTTTSSTAVAGPTRRARRALGSGPRTTCR